MLSQQNALKGSKKEYPIKLIVTDALGSITEVLINDEAELWELIDKELQDSSNSKKNVKQILYELGLRDTVMLLDMRTAQILEWYEAFKYNPTVLNNELWIWSIAQLNKMQPKMF